MNTLIRATELQRVYHTGSVTHAALRGVSFKVEAGEFMAIMGHSGSGKTTLLNLVGALDRPSAGIVEVGGRVLQGLDETALANFRRTQIGFVFQSFNLIDNLTVVSNVELPGLLARRTNRHAVRQRARELLERLGIADQHDKYPWELSGGEQQRTAIARALVNRPTVLLADEPTGNLDSANGQEVLAILDEFNSEGQTVIMVTHDALAAAHAARIVFLHDGTIAGEMPGGNAARIAQRMTELQ